MKQDNVIPFPQEQSVRIRVRERGSRQKAMLAMSILSVLMLSVVVNQWITRETVAGGSSSRNIASLNDSTITNVKWEHELAQQLSQSHGVAAHFGERPSLKDDLIFGRFEGRYGIKMKEGRVESLEYIADEQSEGPLSVEDRAALLRKYHSVFAVSYVDADLAERSSNIETWNLLNEGREVVGKARLTLDGSGNLMSLSLSR